MADDVACETQSIADGFRGERFVKENGGQDRRGERGRGGGASRNEARSMVEMVGHGGVVDSVV